MKTIIVPTDFSSIANNALKYALDMAEQVNGEVIIFHAYQVPISISDAPIILLSVEELEKHANTRMENLIKSIPANPKVTINTKTALGNTIDELEHFCKEENPFAVVMGTKGESAFERALFGSTTLSAIKHLTSPVLVVPPSKSFSPIKKIGFACDFSQLTTSTPVSFIRKFVTDLNAEWYVLNISSKHSKMDSAMTHLLQSSHSEHDQISNENVEEGIENFARSNHLDLIVTIPKKHTLLEGLFRKDHTRELIFHTTLPLLCVHE